MSVSFGGERYDIQTFGISLQHALANGDHYQPRAIHQAVSPSIPRNLKHGIDGLAKPGATGLVDAAHADLGAPKLLGRGDVARPGDLGKAGDIV